MFYRDSQLTPTTTIRNITVNATGLHRQGRLLEGTREQGSSWHSVATEGWGMGAWLPSASSFLCMAFPDGELAQTLPSPSPPGEVRMGSFDASPSGATNPPRWPQPQLTRMKQRQSFLTCSCIWGLFVPLLEGASSSLKLQHPQEPQGPGAVQTTHALEAWRMKRHEYLGTLSKPTDQTQAINELGCHTFLAPKKCMEKVLWIIKSYLCLPIHPLSAFYLTQTPPAILQLVR